MKNVENMARYAKKELELLHSADRPDVPYTNWLIGREKACRKLVEQADGAPRGVEARYVLAHYLMDVAVMLHTEGESDVQDGVLSFVSEALREAR